MLSNYRCRNKEKFEETNSFNNKLKSGRPRILTDRYEQKALRLITSNKCSTAVEVQSILKNDEEIDVSVETIRRVFKRNEFHARAKQKKPLLQITHRKKRLMWAKKYRNWTTEDWKQVIWSDESKFQLFGSDGRKYCWKKLNEPLRDRHI